MYKIEYQQSNADKKAYFETAHEAIQFLRIYKITNYTMKAYAVEEYMILSLDDSLSMLGEELIDYDRLTILDTMTRGTAKFYNITRKTDGKYRTPEYKISKDNNRDIIVTETPLSDSDYLRPAFDSFNEALRFGSKVVEKYHQIL
jgi:hypothetical protein